MQINGGPSTAVNNTFKSLLSGASANALNCPFGPVGLSAQTNLSDDVIYFVGNHVDGGRHGGLGAFHEGENLHPYALHFCGNSLTLFPAFDIDGDRPASALTASAMAWANVSGNTLVQGEQGVRWHNGVTNAIVLKNDFAAAAHRSLTYDGDGGRVQSFQILKNTLNRGVSYHLKLKIGDGSGFFLFKNIYTNGVSNDSLFLDAASSPVHVMH